MWWKSFGVISCSWIVNYSYLRRFVTCVFLDLTCRYFKCRLFAKPSTLYIAPEARFTRKSMLSVTWLQRCCEVTVRESTRVGCWKHLTNLIRKRTIIYDFSETVGRWSKSHSDKKLQNAIFHFRILFWLNWLATEASLMRGVFSNANNINLFLMIFPHLSLDCKLAPVQYR